MGLLSIAIPKGPNQKCERKREIRRGERPSELVPSDPFSRCVTLFPWADCCFNFVVFSGYFFRKIAVSHHLQMTPLLRLFNFHSKSSRFGWCSTKNTHVGSVRPSAAICPSCSCHHWSPPSIHSSWTHEQGPRIGWSIRVRYEVESKDIIFRISGYLKDFQATF